MRVSSLLDVSSSALCLGHWNSMGSLIRLLHVHGVAIQRLRLQVISLTRIIRITWSLKKKEPVVVFVSFFIDFFIFCYQQRRFSRLCPSSANGSFDAGQHVPALLSDDNDPTLRLRHRLPFAQQWPAVDHGHYYTGRWWAAGTNRTAGQNYYDHDHQQLRV